MANGKPSPDSTFNVSQREQERARRKIEIGPKEYFPVKETTETRARERTLVREVRINEARLAKLNEKFEASGEAAGEELLEQIAEGEEKREELLYSQVAAQLRDDQDQAPEVGFLAEHLPIGLVSDLFEFLNQETASADPS